MFEATKELIEAFCEPDKDMVCNIQTSEERIDANVIITKGLSKMYIQISSDKELIGEDMNKALSTTFTDFRRYLDPTSPKFLSDIVDAMIFETQFSEEENTNSVLYKFSAKRENIQISVKIFIINANTTITKASSDLHAFSMLSFYNCLINYFNLID